MIDIPGEIQEELPLALEEIISGLERLSLTPASRSPKVQAPFISEEKIFDPSWGLIYLELR